MVTDILTLQLPPGNEKGSNRIIDFIDGSEFSSELTIAIMLANIDTSLANKSNNQLSTSKKSSSYVPAQWLSFSTSGNHLSTILEAWQ